MPIAIALLVTVTALLARLLSTGQVADASSQYSQQHRKELTKERNGHHREGGSLLEKDMGTSLSPKAMCPRAAAGG